MEIRVILRVILSCKRVWGIVVNLPGGEVAWTLLSWDKNEAMQEHLLGAEGYTVV